MVLRIAVAGATGKTGQHVVRAISAKGHLVVAVTRDPEGKVAKELATLPGVVTKKFADAFDQPIDRAYLCAKSGGTDHVLLETDFIVAAKKAGVKYIVKLSTLDKWMHQYTEVSYARTHLVIEYYLEKGDIPFTCLRANNFHVMIGTDFASVPTSKQYRTGLAPGSAVASVDPADVGGAAAALLLLEDPSPHYGKKYMLSGPRDETAESIGAALKEVLKLDELKYVGNYTDEESVTMYMRFGVPKERAEAAVIHSAHYFRDGKSCLADNPTSPELIALGFPQSTFLDFCRKLYSQEK